MGSRAYRGRSQKRLSFQTSSQTESPRSRGTPSPAGTAVELSEGRK